MTGFAEQQLVYRELVEERRERIRKEFESFDCMFEEDTEWDRQAHIEIVSVAGFDESNMLLSTPFGSSIVIRYRILKLGGSQKTTDEENVVMKGTTASVQSYPAARGSVEFVTYFTVAFLSIAFVSKWCRNHDFAKALSLTQMFCLHDPHINQRLYFFHLATMRVMHH